MLSRLHLLMLPSTEDQAARGAALGGDNVYAAPHPFLEMGPRAKCSGRESDLPRRLREFASGAQCGGLKVEPPGDLSRRSAGIASIRSLTESRTWGCKEGAGGDAGAQAPSPAAELAPEPGWTDRSRRPQALVARCTAPPSGTREHATARGSRGSETTAPGLSRDGTERV